jgi:hypothetical protein
LQEILVSRYVKIPVPRGLELLAQREQFQRLQNLGCRVISELNDRGLKNEASQIEAWLKTVLPAAASFDAPGKRPVLPTHC